MDDLNLMVDKNFISKNITTIIRGSGSIKNSSGIPLKIMKRKI